MSEEKGLAGLLERANLLLDRLDRLVPETKTETDWSASTAFRWVSRNGRGIVEPVRHFHRVSLRDLKEVDAQKKTIRQNTRQFLAGHPANNVLLTGARGTGKSSLVKALLNEFAGRKLRLIEVEKQHLVELPEIVDEVAERPERFILFCDDLSFNADEPGYKALKVVLDGSIAAASDNVLIYATSNRRHLMPEAMRDNLDTRYTDGEVHPAEAVEEKTSLSERFGVWLSFYPFSQEQYLAIVAHWLAHYSVKDSPEVRQSALNWARERGSRSGRAAWQFARDCAGKARMKAEG
ncbi:MAG: ATP-binding protein [Burkholderiales bacterium]